MNAPRRILVLGAAGMLGSAVVRRLAADGFDVIAATRALIGDPPAGSAALLSGDLRDPLAPARLLDAAVPDAVVNCAGLVKQRPEGNDPIACIETNALLPHRMATLCASRHIRFVHIGTDCVFSGDPAGRRGPAGYRETDPTDPVDYYGRSKLLGEVAAPGSVTLRISLVGYEPAGTRRGLVEWFLAAPEPVRGFGGALFTGLTCPVAARLIRRILAEHPTLEGVWHAAAPAISKLDLLRAMRDRARPGLEIHAVDQPVIDRRLDGAALSRRIGWTAPGWDAALDELFPVGAAARPPACVS